MRRDIEMVSGKNVGIQSTKKLAVVKPGRSQDPVFNYNQITIPLP